MNPPSPDTLINRELGILEFQRRVLAQADDPAMPLLERLRFLCIFSSNMDEFFEVRVAGLKEQIRADSTQRSPDGMTPRQQYRAVSNMARDLVAKQYALFNNELIPELAAHGIHFFRRTQWTEDQAAWIRDYFFRELMPVLTPVGLDPSHPFPRVLNKSLNFAVELSGRDAFGRNSGAAVVQAPRALPRVIRLPEEIAGCEYGFVFLSSVLHTHVGELFAGMTVEGCYQFRVTRNSDLFVDDEETKNLRQALQGELPQRNYGAAVRLEVADNCSPSMAAFLLEQFELGSDDLYQANGPVNLVRLMQVPDWVDRPELKFAPFVPTLPARLAKQDDIFAHIRKHDILLHHPFESFQPVIDFIEQAAADPHVVAIRQTVYRTGTDSKLMMALIRAAQSGKEVTAVVELMARFDEEANINWAAKLEEVGAHVVYGVVGHKTHAKLALVIRREEGELRRYAHLGTGNYHARTARLYTDFGLLTADETMTADVASLFTQITGLGKAGKLKRLWQAPFTLHSEVVAAINREAELAAAGKPAAIVAKMNALLEPQVIAALYAASQAGVKIDLIIRGVCALKPGIAGLSENIRVRSIVGRFLEHTRIFYFRNGGDEQVYLSSADWMDRNFFRRIETGFPILNPKLKKRVIAEGLKPYLRDNVQAWEMLPDGSYRRRSPRRAAPYSAQAELLALLSRQK
ncbi:MAG: polyphosphate kinase 1 [Hydrogenophilales bacterium 17-64-11]|nr:MAG: polyphosphate kinase 1 [Hydrogenophilales bacterium 17-64-11]